MLTPRDQAEAITAAYEPPAIGRPAFLADANKLAKLLTALRAGNYRHIACRSAEIAYSTFSRQLEADERFRAAVEKAEADAECELIENTARAGRKEQFWAANMTLLERKYPDRWGRRQEAESGPKVLVQIGAKDSDVQVNVIANYQTHTESESLSSQGLADTSLCGFAGESQSEARQSGAKADD